MADFLPVILCGKSEEIGETIITNIKPEFEVIYFVMKFESGAFQIPALLQGEEDVTFDSELGSKDHSRGVAAIVLGGGYEGAGIQLMREAAKGIKPVPWLRPDMSKPAPPLGPEYRKAMVERIKVTAKELQEKGTMSEDEVMYY
ncbi:hypothetical protein BO94DRAFT_537156 [Aspergillus sclerotioniger CBS 115572]|uniref:Uncharacterized protein n=1 Tax=Aspergillus sclerotioniger CBS 115572 TaxID=1450535 RepID=A0A317W3V6_9EURO|nr:hypothetical protein BO94DRAFT_537156 [Aspergillus sclerotioniger CBS 115572]PWY80281.1 hypothetical protein BO94DRAFT_537156 [Aspergillus sclerotioniger CBS 115572]